jgi:cysteinyl-tRNA synthetase
MIREVNKFLDNHPSGQKANELVLRARDLLTQTGKVLNIFTRTPEEWYDALMLTKRIPYTKTDILQKIQQRKDARQRKDWAAADAIRKELEAQGIILEDKKDGSAWKVRVSRQGQ